MGKARGNWEIVSRAGRGDRGNAGRADKVCYLENRPKSTAAAGCSLMLRTLRPAALLGQANKSSPCAAVGQGGSARWWGLGKALNAVQAV